ncbi:hypothetical protein CBW54_10475 [Yersinia kristensenii]|nr:hypothetical protein CBW54_10475 [Yersinia kristensenii]
MLSKEPVRIRHNWDAAVVAICDFCSHSEMTLPHLDGGKICASCCDAETLSQWQSYAQDVVSELLSLREQLEALKRLSPVAYTDSDELQFQHATSDMWPKALGFGRDIPLFTAARPSELESAK